MCARNGKLIKKKPRPVVPGVRGKEGKAWMHSMINCITQVRNGSDAAVAVRRATSLFLLTPEVNHCQLVVLSFNFIWPDGGMGGVINAL